MEPSDDERSWPQVTGGVNGGDDDPVCDGNRR
jgi:hypothetical protein